MIFHNQTHRLICSATSSKPHRNAFSIHLPAQSNDTTIPNMCCWAASQAATEHHNGIPNPLRTLTARHVEPGDAKNIVLHHDLGISLLCRVVATSLWLACTAVYRSRPLLTSP